MMRSGASADCAADITIYVDGNLVYEKNKMTKWKETDNFSVDVLGTYTLQSVVQISSEYSGVWVYLEVD